jgi:hypothetical protein
MALNGWQRLWVVGSALWLGVFGLQAYMDWPAPYVPPRPVILPSAVAAPGERLSLREYARRMDERREELGYDEPDPSVVAAKTSELRWHAADIAARRMLIPPAFAYVVGLSVGWIRRGFTEQ